MSINSKRILGKPPLDFLKSKIFTKLGSFSNKIILGPNLGVDASVLRLGKNEIIAIHTNPITGAKSHLGYFSIIISSNDIASIGALPSFASICFLLPEGTNLSFIEKIQDEIHLTAKKLNIAIVGGHIEITKSVNWPIIVTTMLGYFKNNFVERFKKIEKIKKGIFEEEYFIILIKPIGIEATSILAHDFEDKLSQYLSKTEIFEAKNLINKISILKEASLLYSKNLLIYAHDPTEGGIASALKEISLFLNSGLIVSEEKIILLEISKKIFELLKLDPLKVISSGCLLGIISKKDIINSLNLLKENKIPASIIGKLTTEKECIIHRKNGKKINLLEEEIEEELWKLF